MWAIQYAAPGRVEQVTVPCPVPEPGELLLRSRLLAICGSDLHFLHDRPKDAFPAPPGFSGHECVAVVEDGADGLRRGQRVLAIAPDYNAFAQYLTARPATVIPVPEGLSDTQALLAQQLGTVLYCTSKLKHRCGGHVAIVGQGPAGLLFTKVFSLAGCSSIVALDVADHRLRCAVAMGATHTVNCLRDDPVEALREYTSGEMAHLVVEAVGREETFNLCADLVRNHGEVAIFGVPKRTRITLRLEAFQRKNARLITSVFAQREPGLRSFRQAMACIADKRLDPEVLVSHRLPVEEAAHGFALARTRADGAIKVLLTT